MTGHSYEARRQVYDFGDGVAVTIEADEDAIEMLLLDGGPAGQVAMTGDTLERLVRVRAWFAAQQEILRFLAVNRLVSQAAIDWLHLGLFRGWTEADSLDAAAWSRTPGACAGLDEARPPKLGELIETIAKGET